LVAVCAEVDMDGGLGGGRVWDRVVALVAGIDVFWVHDSGVEICLI